MQVFDNELCTARRMPHRNPEKKTSTRLLRKPGNTSIKSHRLAPSIRHRIPAFSQSCRGTLCGFSKSPLIQFNRIVTIQLLKDRVPPGCARRVSPHIVRRLPDRSRILEGRVRKERTPPRPWPPVGQFFWRDRRAATPGGAASTASPRAAVLSPLPGPVLAGREKVPD